MSIRELGWKIDLVLRFIYVALVPVWLAAFSLLMPVGGLVVTTAIATVIALTGTESWRRKVGGTRYVGKFLAGFARLGEYYAEHPPKPLVYYILYPALFPYWLIKRSARREILVYRRISVVVVVIAIAGGALAFLTKWHPDIKFNTYLGVVVGSMVLQLLLTFVIVMPIVTTVITYHRRGLKKALIATLAIGVVIAAPIYVFMRRLDLPTFDTRLRVKARTKEQPERAKAAMTRAIEEAIAFAKTHPDGAGVEDHAREVLEDLYRHDEAATFHLMNDGKGQIVLLARWDSRPAAAWRVFDVKTRAFVDDLDKLSPTIRTALGL